MSKLMTIDEAIHRLRSLNEEVPIPMRLPTKAEVSEAEQELRLQFHPDYRKYLLEASDVAYGTKEPATVAYPNRFTDLRKVCEVAWGKCGVPRHLLPICEDNADFFCMNPAGEVIFWSHNGGSSEKWVDLATWINDIWIGEST
jgi:hypothetical protein